MWCVLSKRDASTSEIQPKIIVGGDVFRFRDFAELWSLIKYTHESFKSKFNS